MEIFANLGIENRPENRKESRFRDGFPTFGHRISQSDWYFL